MSLPSVPALFAVRVTVAVLTVAVTGRNGMALTAAAIAVATAAADWPDVTPTWIGTLSWNGFGM